MLTNSPSFSTVVDLMQYRSNHQPSLKGYTFLTDGESQEISLTYQQLDTKARLIAAHLQSLNLVGERALLLYPPGLQFIAAFLGCWYAGVIAVPVYPPRKGQNLLRVKSIAADAEAQIILTTQSLLNDSFSLKYTIDTDNLAEIYRDLEKDWKKPEINSDTLAFLQYTSGSTGNPKGVMVSHGNLLNNSALINQNFGHSSESKGMIWLPPYHDMGLIGGVIQPLYSGFPLVLMAPVMFVQKPLRWLSAISDYKATTSGGPNFAYEACLQKITAEQRANLDLSSWEVAFCGAEPIRVETLERFAEVFAESGFRKEAFLPCYGLAEATLFVSGGDKTTLPKAIRVDTKALAQNQIYVKEDLSETTPIVSCGKFAAEIVIVNPDDLLVCGENQVGEIWVAGESIAQGYWGKLKETEEVFKGRIAGEAGEAGGAGEAGRAGGAEGVKKKQKACGIGSVKTNIGHLDTAAGIASLIKAVLALKYKQIPPSLNFEQPNPQIDFDNSPFYVNSSLSAWETDKLPRRAGVSSFGIGGTNAHVVLEETEIPNVETRYIASLQQLLLISAKTESALQTATKNLANYLETNPNLDLANIAYTLNVGRQEFEHRRFLVCQDIESAIELLKSPDSEKVFTHNHIPTTQSVAFMFSGQGSQYVNMGRELYETQTVFRETVDNCCKLIKPHIGFDLLTLIYPSEKGIGNREQGTGNREQGVGSRNSNPMPDAQRPMPNPQSPMPNLTDTACAQPAIFIIEYALAKLWMSWGIIPEVSIGHSIGEYVAATIAGVFSLEDALEIVALRGRLMQKCPTGSMLAVSLTESELKQFLDKDLTIAVSNSSKMGVVSGNNDAINKLEENLPAEEISCRRLHTSHAFHSSMMESAVKPLVEHIGKVKLNSPDLPFISNVTGTWITPEQATDANY